MSDGVLYIATGAKFIRAAVHAFPQLNSGVMLFRRTPEVQRTWLRTRAK